MVSIYLVVVLALPNALEILYMICNVCDFQILLWRLAVPNLQELLLKILFKINTVERFYALRF